MWNKLGDFAPHTKSVIEEIARSRINPVMDLVPEWLFDKKITQLSPEWGNFLNEINDSGVTNRERMLRYLITRSVVDQGSDIEGVEEWHSNTFSTLYKVGLRIFDDLSLMITQYPKILDIADRFREQTIIDRAENWASVTGNRSAANYWPFTVDGQRGKGNTHWFLTARVFPTLFLAKTCEGGLSEIVFGRSDTELPREMARRLRNDKNYKTGLGWVMGDKACDLFAKWAIGTYRLTEGLDCNWLPADCPIPMDQRIGRLMIRTGFMEEFYGVASEMSVMAHGWTPKSNQSRPSRFSNEIPEGDWHLTVMDFRRSSTVPHSFKTEAYEWIKATLSSEGRTFSIESTRPQEVISLLCRSYNSYSGGKLTPVEVDDYFMEIGGGPCTDRSPACSKCGLNDVCQANNDLLMIRLKNCFT